MELLRCLLTPKNLHHVSSAVILRWHRRDKSSFPIRCCSYPRQGSGGCVDAWHDFDGCVFDIRDVLQQLHLTWLCPGTLPMSAAIRRIWTACESSPASFPTRSTSALAGDVVVVSEVVSVVAVTGSETVVLVLYTGGAPSASVSAGPTRDRSAADCVVSLDVVSWLGTAAASVVALSGDHLAD